ncbi:type I restriction endonuclease subunit R [Actinocrinis puniceicyclus]|uniref:Type I restriction enzyme endonuclease subunit n=1 Tax=Actinocrinis puniceicyclus TaxID=977794 RepID=A0A8J7WUT5_9ACTN|nr:type I restriction endonuclease subunit R [Actinocrinis puniceicyclus]MBS2966347.1 type I restriction endonuclease subunit R [Actinocrinis puniceicyclus]
MSPSPTGMSEDALELVLLDELGELAWPSKAGRDISPRSGERESWAELHIPHRIREAIARLNPQLPTSAVNDAYTELVTAKSQDAFAENKRVHDFLTKGVRITYTDEFGAEHSPTVRLIDYANPEANDFLAVNQVTVKDGNKHCRFDVVLYVNGMPLVFIELKKPGEEDATVEIAFRQLMNYRSDLPLAYRFNLLCLASDGVNARYGTAFTPFEHYARWNVDENGIPVDTGKALDFGGTALGISLHGLFEQNRLIDLLSGFVNFADTGDKKQKRIAKPHQYFAVTKAARAIVRATREDGKAGVVWHTQGSGKSEEMVLTAARAMKGPALGNPTIVVVTDRLDLDDQLFNTFQESSILPAAPKQIKTREALRDELANVRTGGILFVVLQKFGRTKAEKDANLDHPLLSERRNIILMVDEAHRSHYDTLDGYAKHIRDALPKATLLAFTGTPLSKADRNTRHIFGKYIDIYDLRRAVDDEATVRVLHDSRLVDLQPTGDLTALDEAASRATEGLTEQERRDAERAAIRLEDLFGADARIAKLADDLIAHWEERRERMRPFLDGHSGKAMIVCVSRNVCVKLYDALRERRPHWHDDAPDKGLMKIVFSGGNSDPAHLKKHLLRPSQSKAVQARAKDENDPLELLIVCDMLLTGYDAPPLHTMYMDKPLHGANLMQALARVNRRFMDKQDGLLVGYAALTDKLHEALAEYSTTDHDEQSDPTLGRDIAAAVRETRETHENLCRMLTGIPWRAALDRAARNGKYISAVLFLVDKLRSPQHPDNLVDPGDEDLGTRFRHESTKLERLYALCSAKREDLRDLVDDIGYFHDVRVWMLKFDADANEARGLPTPRGVEFLLRQLAAKAIEAGGVTDLYAEAGIELPDLSHLDAAYIKKLQESATPHLQAEALRRLVEARMRKVNKHNLVRQQAFSERLQTLMNKYHNQQLTSAQVIAELVEMAKQLHADESRGQNFTPPLGDNELALYDAVAENPSAVDVMGTDVLAQIARDLVEALRRDLKTDWLQREAVQAKLRSTIKRLLRKYGYPPDRQPAAVELVIRQVETFAEEWSEPAH